MLTLPKIDGDAREVLRAIQERGVIAGMELLCMARLETPERLLPAVKQLVEAGLIGVNGNLADASESLSAVFNIRPSALPLIRYLMHTS